MVCAVQFVKARLPVNPCYYIASHLSTPPSAKLICLSVELSLKHILDKTKVISADLLDFDLDFEDIIMFGNISVLVTFQFW